MGRAMVGLMEEPPDGIKSQSGEYKDGQELEDGAKGIGRRGSSVVEMSKVDLPYDLGISTNVYGEDRSKKRSFAATMAPSGFEKAIVVVNDKENRKSEQVGEDAHLGE